MVIKNKTKRGNEQMMKTEQLQQENERLRQANKELSTFNEFYEATFLKMEKDNEGKNLFNQDLNLVFDSDLKRSLLFIAIRDLIEKASKENWANNERFYESVVSLLKINKDLSKNLQGEIN